MADSKITTNHDEIRRWVEARDGHPARVKGTERGGESGGGLLRIDYPGYSGEETLEEITWEQFFDQFEKNKLAFLYQDTLAGGETSRFSKLIDRESAEAKAA
ncbi:MAG TPA: hypothetical protein VN696_02675 [Pyrinomonadaceae bacterium]|nr:hypothetical protein [Pyrinomonadaceae bacterium]